MTVSKRPALVIKLTHTGHYKDGRTNSGPVMINDLDTGLEQQDRKVPTYVPYNGSIFINASSRSMLSFEQGPIRKFTDAGVLRSNMYYIPEEFTNATLPAASSYPVGVHVWNSSDQTTLWSDGTNWVVGNAKPIGAAGGDLSGTYPNPQVIGIESIPIQGGAPVNGDVLMYNAATNKWDHAQIVFSGGPPTGPAGGDLSGLYPNPTIALLAVTDAKVATANKDGLVTIPSMRTLGTGAQQACAGNDPRLSNSRIPTGSAGGDLTGTYPNPSLKAVGTAGVYGSVSQVAVVTTDSKGRVTNAVSTSIQISESQVTNLVTDLGNKADKTTSIFAGSGLIGGGDLSADRTISMPNVGIAGVYGSVTKIPVITTDAQGRVSNITELSISVIAPGDAAGGDLTGTYPNPSLIAVGSLGTYGSSSKVPVFTTDTKGRVTNVTETSIQITESQVVNLVTDLSNKADKIVTISAGSGLTGGGDLSADRTISMPDIGTSGTYGSSTKVPVITTDNQGRVSGVVETIITGVAPGGSAGGDLSGIYPNPSVVGFQNRPVDPVAPNIGDAYTWDGTKWVPTGVSPSYRVMGSFSDTTTQPTLAGTVADTAYYIQYNTVEISQGVTLQNNLTGNPTRIKVSQPGIYEVQYSAQLYRDIGTPCLTSIWLEKNREDGGGPIERTNSILSTGGNVKASIPFCSIMVSMTSTDYIEIGWSTDDSGVTLQSTGVQTGPTRPVDPSIIVNVKKISS